MTTDLMFRPSETRKPADMIDLTPVSKHSPEVACSADAPPADRELVGRRGSAPIAQLRATSGLLVSGKSRDRLPLRLDTVPTEAGGHPIAADKGQQVLETGLPPWRMICALRMRSQSGDEAFGTGWLVGPRTIVTAGHLVHHQEFCGGWAESIEVSAGRTPSSRPFSRFTTTRFAAADRWVENADPEFDVGCIQLDRPLGDLTGWFGLASPTAAELNSALVNISGYPAIRGDGAEQYFQANRIAHVGDRRLSYDLDTYGAQCGAPTWIHRTPSAPPVVVALQAASAGANPFDLGTGTDSALRITPEIFDMIKTWIHRDISVAA